MRIVMIASSKGGIGKTTVALGIARALKKKDKKVLLVDLDFSNACIDILTNVDSLYTIGDVVKGECPPREAIAISEEGIYVLPAASVVDLSSVESSEEKFRDAIIGAATVVGADYVILDTGAGISEGFKVACEVSESAIVVATHSPVSLRSAENTATRIKEKGIEEVNLIVNSFDIEGIVKFNQHQGLVDIINQAHIKLLGVVPFDYELVLEAEKDENAKLSKESVQAFDNISERVMGADVPIFNGMNKIRRKRKLLF